LAGCLLATGCSESKPPIVFTGEHVRFGTHEDKGELCAGTLPYLDDYAGYLRKRLGGPHELLQFYWIPDDEERSEFCNVVACTNARAVYSAVVPDEHELVHATHYRDRVAARPLEEGFAELYGDDADIRVPVAGDIEGLLRTPPDQGVPPGSYPLAGHFVSYLATELEPDLLEDLAGASNLRDPYETTESTFMGVYGQSLSSAIEDYDTNYPVCDQLEYRDNEFDCEGTAIPVESAGTTVTASLDCGDEEVLGPRYGERWTRRLIEVPAAGMYQLAVTKTGGDRTGRVRLTRCGAGCTDSPIVTTVVAQVGSSDTTQACLTGGSHVVRFAIAEDDEGELSLTVTPTNTPCG
jgi:hypothetical protein